MDLFNSSIIRKRIHVYICEIVYSLKLLKYFEFNGKIVQLISTLSLFKLLIIFFIELNETIPIID